MPVSPHCEDRLHDLTFDGTISVQFKVAVLGDAVQILSDKRSRSVRSISRSWSCISSEIMNGFQHWPHVLTGTRPTLLLELNAPSPR